MTSHIRHPGAQLAIAEAGGVNALARLLGISGAAVCLWKHVPEHHVASIAEKLAIPKHELRPDLHPPPPLPAPEGDPNQARTEPGNGHRPGDLDGHGLDARLVALARRLDEMRGNQQSTVTALRDLERSLSAKEARDERDSENVATLIRRVTAIERSLTGPDATTPTRPTRRHPRGRD